MVPRSVREPQVAGSRTLTTVNARLTWLVGWLSQEYLGVLLLLLLLLMRLNGLCRIASLHPLQDGWCCMWFERLFLHAATIGLSSAGD